MLERAGIRPGLRVLDIASGAGEPALTAAKLVGSSGYVLGTDLVEAMLVFARQKASEQGIDNIEFRCVDGEELNLEPESFDAATCRWGLMFMPDPEGCLRRVHTALKPGGRIALTCWAEPTHNPYMTLPLSVLASHTEVPKPPPGAPGLFAFADADRLRSCLAAARFTDISVEEATVNMRPAESGADYCRTMQELAATIAALLGQLSEEKRQVVEHENRGRSRELPLGGCHPDARPHLGRGRPQGILSLAFPQGLQGPLGGDDENTLRPSQRRAAHPAARWERDGTNRERPRCHVSVRRRWSGIRDRDCRSVLECGRPRHLADLGQHHGAEQEDRRRPPGARVHLPGQGTLRAFGGRTLAQALRRAVREGPVSGAKALLSDDDQHEGSRRVRWTELGLPESRSSAGLA